MQHTTLLCNVLQSPAAVNLTFPVSAVDGVDCFVESTMFANINKLHLH